MKKINLNIGIIDDDETKVTQIMIKLSKGVENASAEKVQKYSKYELKPVELKKYDIDPSTILDVIRTKKLNCLLIDYKLSSYESVDYNGIDLAKIVLEEFFAFPIFILTSHEDDLFDSELFDAYQVFDFGRYMSEDNERIELNFKVIEQILKYQNQLTKWEDELKSILPLFGSSNEIDSRIIELDGLIEKTISGKSTVGAKIKCELQNSKIDDLINKIDKLLEE